MSATMQSPYLVDISEVEYLRHGARPLLARLYRPRGKGPFPMLVEAHGGAWTKQDRMRNAMLDQRLACSGIVVAAIDFRMPPADPGYPASVADIHYAVRWFKSRAAEFGGDARRMGLIGTSSGGHQAMLIAMRPHDPRYAALPLAGGVDATVRCVIPCWPVIDPLGRYHKLKDEAARGDRHSLEIMQCHDLFWKDEAGMDECSPACIMERGEKVAMPPVLYVQGAVDQAHPRAHLDRFVAAWHKAGGQLELHLAEGMDQNFMNENPDSPVTAQAIEAIVAFVHRETA